MAKRNLIYFPDHFPARGLKEAQEQLLCYKIV